MGEMWVSNNPDDILVAYGLGSCVAICLYDPLAKVGGLLHALLPDNSNRPGKATKFVQPGTDTLIAAMLKRGARRHGLIAYLCGGAKMIIAPGFENTLNIGSRNIAAAKQALQSARIRLRAEETGGNIGRTVRLYINRGRVTVKTLKDGEKTLE